MQDIGTVYLIKKKLMTLSGEFQLGYLWLLICNITWCSNLQMEVNLKKKNPFSFYEYISKEQRPELD